MLRKVKIRMKIIKTCILYMSFFTLGASISVTGPCLLDLQHMVETDTQHIALIYTARSIGYVAGALFGGILLDIFKYKQAVLTVCNLLITITMFGIPWSRYVGILLSFMIVNGFTLGAIETGGNVMCMQLWGKDSDSFLQALHFTFGLGGLVAPLISAPFLEYLKEELDSSSKDELIFGNPHTNSSTDNMVEKSNITNSLHHIPQIVYPFSMIGGFALLVTILYFSLSIISPKEDVSREERKSDNSNRSFFFMFFTILFSFILLLLISGTDLVYMQSLTTYAVKRNPDVTTVVGSYMTSAFWGSFTISRLASIFLAMKVKSLYMLIGNISILTFSAVILLVFMPNQWALWVASVMSGIGLSSCYAATLGFIGSNINLSNKISGFIIVGSATGEMVLPFIVTYFIDIIPDMFSYIRAAVCVLMTFLIIILYCIFKRKSVNIKTKNIELYTIDCDTNEHETPDCVF